MPAFYRFVFTVKKSEILFCTAKAGGKGCAFVNGFHLGRFWEVGPQKRLYLPGVL